MTTKTADQQAEELFWTIALPSRLGRKLGLEVMGRPYKIYPWIKYVENEVMAMLKRPGREVLIVRVPPQEGKTSYSGMWLPFWYVGMNPNNQIIMVAYNDDYASAWGLRVRTLVEQYGQQLFGVGLNRSQQSIADWKTTKGFGGMLSAGIGGGITGNPGHFIFIDDVIKNMEEAGSATAKRKHLEEWDGSISARFQEDTKVLITATCWAEDDLGSEIYTRSLAEDYEGIPVRMIKIKAIAEPDEDEEAAGPDWRDFLGRRVGETLEGQHSRGFFLEKKASVSPRVWNALYQADPQASEGSMFPPDNWGWYDPDDRPTMYSLYRGWDTAATKGGGDFSVGGHVGKADDGRIYVLDVRRFQKNESGVRDEVQRTAQIDGFNTSILMEEERAGAGKAVVAGYKETLRGFNFKGIRPDGSKVSRFTNYADMQQRGHVLLPRRADGTSPDWVQAFIREHKQQMNDGRGPRHDDQIDAIAICVNEMYGSGVIEIHDPQIANRDAAGMLERIAHDHGVQMAGAMPSRLSALLGRNASEPQDPEDPDLPQPVPVSTT